MFRGVASMASRGDQSSPRLGLAAAPPSPERFYLDSGFTQALRRVVRAYIGCRGGLSRAKSAGALSAFHWVGTGSRSTVRFSFASAHRIGQMGLSLVSDQTNRFTARRWIPAGRGACTRSVPNAPYSASQLLSRREATHLLLNRCRNAFFASLDCIWLRFSPHTAWNAADHPRDAYTGGSG